MSEPESIILSQIAQAKVDFLNETKADQLLKLKTLTLLNVGAAVSHLAALGAAPGVDIYKTDESRKAFEALAYTLGRIEVLAYTLGRIEAAVGEVKP